MYTWNIEWQGKWNKDKITRTWNAFVENVDQIGVEVTVGSVVTHLVELALGKDGAILMSVALVSQLLVILVDADAVIERLAALVGLVGD